MAKDQEPKDEVTAAPHTLSRRRFFELSAGAAALAALGPAAAGCGVEVPPPVEVTAGVEPVVFLHLSDSHFGGVTKDNEALDPVALKTDPKVLLTALIEEVVPGVDPLCTVHTGDLVNEGYEEAPWIDYKDVFTQVAGAPSYPRNYVEILGNHDVKHATAGQGLAYFAKYSKTGEVTGSPGDRHGIMALEQDGQRIRLIRTNTSEAPAGTNQNTENIAGYFTLAQQQALLADPGFDAGAHLNVVLGHHPLSIKDGPTAAWQQGRADMEKLVGDAQAPIYLCVHVHAPAVGWVEPAGTRPTLMVQASTFGRHGQLTSFYLVAYDQDQPSARLVYIDAMQSPCVAWPLVFITAPANATLGGKNPYATEYAAGAPANLRAMVFPPVASGGATVKVKWASAMVDGGPHTFLTNTTGRLWEGPVSLKGLTPGLHTVTVTAAVDVVKGTDHQVLVGTDAIEVTVV